MGKFRICIAAMAVSACLTTGTAAADMYEPGWMKDAPRAPSAHGWTGFTLGAGVGGMFTGYGVGAAGSFDADTTTPATVDTFSTSDDSTERPPFGTLQLGYDRHLNPGFVVGVFADYDFQGDNAASFAASVPLPLSGGPGDLLSVVGTAEVEDSWTIGGRLGYLANPSMLVYGLVGWTHADISVSGAYTTNIGLGAPVLFAEEDSLDAVTVGAGVEMLLVPSISLKFEYRYTDLGGLSAGSSLIGLAGGLSDGDSAVDVDTDIHSIRAVLTWRPGM